MTDNKLNGIAHRRPVYPCAATRVQIANEALQIHGGYGFIKDYPVEKFCRDVKLCTIGEGTSEIQTLVIARQLLSPQDQLTVACS